MIKTPLPRLQQPVFLEYCRSLICGYIPIVPAIRSFTLAIRRRNDHATMSYK
jgi:hypothetical protein